jgi:hypothetical protein
MGGLLLLVLALSPAEARRQPVGSVVTVRGHVVVASGVFASFRGDAGFVLGDARAGLYVVSSSAFREGDGVEAQGRLREDHGLLVLDASSVRVWGGRRVVRPLRLALGAVGEASEGRLVRVEGRLARTPVSDLPYGYKMFLADPQGRELQVFLPASVAPPTAAVGTRLRVTGWSAQYDRVYEVVPRRAADLEAVR